MITRYGMSEKFGPMGLATIENQYLSGNARLEFSDVTAAQIDEEIRVIIDKAYTDCLQLLRENADKIHLLAKYLLKFEKIDGDEFNIVRQGDIVAVVE